MDADNISSLIQSAHRHLAEEDTAFILCDFDGVVRSLSELKSVFPETTCHAVAVKANPLIGVLTLLKENGFGAECASLGECQLALKAGILPQNIVFDSPAKTVADLRFALEEGIRINCDSISECERISKLLDATMPKQSIGLRVNPQIGEGSIATTSVAGQYSKFGVPLNENSKVLESLYLGSPFLNGIHVHLGSQGCGMDLLLEGIKSVYDFAERVNKKSNDDTGSSAIRVFDIGGGASVQYTSSDPVFSLTSYVNALKETCPKLFTDYQLITEFGRYIHAPHAIAVSCVEAIKDVSGTKTAVIHFGADLLLRECYHPEDWPHNLSVYTAEGVLKTGGEQPYHIVGPLCFSGDIIAKDYRLPAMEAGDYLVVHDVGAYTFSMWSRYNSRFFPKVLASSAKKGLEVIKKRETIEDLYSFWGY